MSTQRYLSNLESPVRLVWSNELVSVFLASTTAPATCSTASQSAFVLIPCTKGGSVRMTYVSPGIVDMVV